MGIKIVPARFALVACAFCGLPGQADIVSVGGAVVLREPPSSILHNRWESDVEIRGWLEREVLLASSLTVGHSLPGFIDDVEDIVNGNIAAGETVRSYMVRADPIGVGPVVLEGHVVFNTRILGVFIGNQLGPTDSLLGRPGITYNANPLRGLELDGPGNEQDSFQISPGRYRIDFVMQVGEWTDDIRIITAAEPGCLADYNGLSDSGDIVDFLDFIADFAACDGQSPPCGQFGDPDLNGDGVIDILDLLDFLQAFDQGC